VCSHVPALRPIAIRLSSPRRSADSEDHAWTIPNAPAQRPRQCAALESCLATRNRETGKSPARRTKSPRSDAAKVTAAANAVLVLQWPRPASAASQKNTSPPRIRVDARRPMNHSAWRPPVTLYSGHDIAPGANQEVRRTHAAQDCRCDTPKAKLTRPLELQIRQRRFCRALLFRSYLIRNAADFAGQPTWPPLGCRSKGCIHPSSNPGSGEWGLGRRRLDRHLVFDQFWLFDQQASGNSIRGKRPNRRAIMCFNSPVSASLSFGAFSISKSNRPLCSRDFARCDGARDNTNSTCSACARAIMAWRRSQTQRLFHIGANLWQSRRLLRT